jgi:UDP-N-acetylglucosamine/UDP-N-acetylgalactosamine diphosphorylase
VIEPAFIGFHVLSGSEMSSRMIPKAFSKEKVGNFCRQHGRVVVIEYSDMPDTLTSLRDEKGQFVYRAGSVAIHLLAT